MSINNDHYILSPKNFPIRANKLNLEKQSLNQQIVFIGEELIITIEVVLGLFYNTNDDSWDQKTFNINNFLYSGLLSQDDKTKIESLGLHTITEEYQYDKVAGLIGSVEYSNEFDYEFVSLYSDLGTTKVSSNKTDFLLVRNNTIPYYNSLIIKSIVAFNTPVKSWKVRISKKITKQQLIISGILSYSSNLVFTSQTPLYGIITNDYSIVIEPSQNGYIEASSMTSVAGQKITLQIFPEEGYELNSLTVMAGETSIPTYQTSDGFVFTMPENSVTVSSSFQTLALYAYFSNDKSPVNFQSSGNHYLYDDSGNAIHFNPEFEYIPKSYTKSDDSIVTIPSTDARKVYFLFNQGVSSFISYLSLYHYVYYILNDVATVNYEMIQATLSTAWVSPDKLKKTIETNMTVYLYDDNGNQIISPSDSPFRASIVFYYNDGIKSSNYDGVSAKIKITQYGYLRIKTSETLTIDKVEYSIQPVINL